MSCFKFCFFAFTLMTPLMGISQTSEFTNSLFEAIIFTPKDSFTHGVEGPSVDRNGNVYAVNFYRQGTMGKVTPDGKASIFTILPGYSIANGSRFDSKGNMLLADYVGHNIFKLDMRTGNLTVLAHEPTMTQPNDIAIDSKDNVYASDPDFKNSKGRVWLIEPNGRVTLLDSLSTGIANGIEVSPDEKKLYIGSNRQVWIYDLAPNGHISNKRLLIEFPDFSSDGMRCDVDGNLYVARIGKGVVAKVSPEGKVLQEIKLKGRAPTNVAFGGKDGRTVYVTLMDQGNLEEFRVDVPGREWKMQERR